MSRVETYIKGQTWRSRRSGANENANRLRSVGGLKAYLAENEIARYMLKHIYPPRIAKAHIQGYFHIHDLGSGIVPYCAGWSLQDLLSRGFIGPTGVVQSRPPKHLSSALGQLLNAVGVLQQEWAGAQAYNSVDVLLAPFIYYDGLTYRQVEQAIQEFVYGINEPTRWGFETPFLNFTFDLIPPDDLENQAVIVGGKLQDKTYGDFEKEIEMFNLAFLDVMYEGDANSSIFRFPIPTYLMDDNFSWDTEVGQRLAKVTAKFGLPYFQNCSENTGLNRHDVRSMCCHLNLDLNQLRRKTGGLFGYGDVTGSIGVVTLNLPALAYESQNEVQFFENLIHYMDLAKESLIIKRAVCSRSFAEGLMPYSQMFLSGLDRHFSTIGLVGGEEACHNLLGCSIADPEGLKLMKRVLTVMRDRLIEYQQQTGDLWNLEATPAEGCSHRLAKIDVKTRPGCYVSGTRKLPYYTNSTLLPVNYTENLGKAVRHQEQLQRLYTGGTVFHVFLQERPDERVIPFLVDRLVQRTCLPYFTITPTFSVCQQCHQTFSGEHWECPVCGQPTDVMSRVVGYLSNVRAWNEGKQQEWQDRIPYYIE